MEKPLVTHFPAARLLTGLLLLLSFCGLFSTSLAQDDPFQPLEFGQLDAEHWLNRASFTEFAVLPWNEKGGLKAEKSPDALGAALKPAQLQWPMVRIQADPEGRVLVTGPKEILALGTDGKVAGRYPLPQEGLVDMALTPEGNLVYLQKSGGVAAVLGMLGKGTAGKPVWKKELNEFPVGNLLWTNGRLALSKFVGYSTELWAVDLKTGDFAEKIMEFAGNPWLYAGKDGEVCFVSIDSSDGLAFNWNTVKPDAEPVKWEGGDDAENVLKGCIGADGKSNAYGGHEYSVGRLNFDGGQGFVIDMEACLAGGEGEMYFSSWDAPLGRLMVLKQSSQGPAQQMEVKVPDWISMAHNRPVWRLAKIEGGLYHLRGRDPQSHVWHHLLVYPQTGTFVVKPPKEGEGVLGDQLQEVQTWAVMRDGSVIFPVLGEKALRLVRMTVK